MTPLESNAGRGASAFPPASSAKAKSTVRRSEDPPGARPTTRSARQRTSRVGIDPRSNSVDWARLPAAGDIRGETVWHVEIEGKGEDAGTLSGSLRLRFDLDALAASLVVFEPTASTRRSARVSSCPCSMRVVRSGAGISTTQAASACATRSPPFGERACSSARAAFEVDVRPGASRAVAERASLESLQARGARLRRMSAGDRALFAGEEAAVLWWTTPPGDT